jgi:tetratricopeptide (TPR) repeat protein
MVNKLSSLKLKEKAQEIYQAGDYPSAAQAFAEASVSYANEGDRLMSAEMENNQSVTLLRDKHPQAALDAAWATDEVFAQAGDMRRQGMALANQASALEALKRFNEAIDFYTRAGEAFEKAGEMDLRVDVMQLLSALYLRCFKPFDAMIALQSGLVAVKHPAPKQRFMKMLLKMLLFIRL